MKTTFTSADGSTRCATCHLHPDACVCGHATLTDVLRIVTDAKMRVFRAQDAADAIGDRELKKRLLEAREWLEASDRRISSLILESNKR